MVPMQVDMDDIEDAEKVGRGMDALFNIQESVCKIPTIIKLAHLRDVIDSILKEEISMSKGAEILNDVVLEAEREEVTNLRRKLIDLHKYTYKIQQELIKLKAQ